VEISGKRGDENGADKMIDLDMVDMETRLRSQIASRSAPLNWRRVQCSVLQCDVVWCSVLQNDLDMVDMETGLEIEACYALHY